MGPPSYKLPIPFPYFKGFLWEWYGSSMGTPWDRHSHFWGVFTNFPLKICYPGPFGNERSNLTNFSFDFGLKTTKKKLQLGDRRCNEGWLHESHGAHVSLSGFISPKVSGVSGTKGILNLISPVILGVGVFPYISRIHTAYIGEDASVLGT